MTGQPAYANAYPFNIDAQKADEPQWRRLAGAWGDGIVNDVVGSAFQVTPSASDRTILVSLSEMRIQGIHFEPVDDTVTVTLPSLSGGHLRADLIVAHFDASDRSVQVITSAGTAVLTGATPAFPDLEQDPDGVWEMPFWGFAGGVGAASTLTRTDMRRWLGWIPGMVANAAALPDDAPMGTRLTTVDTGHEWLRRLVSGGLVWYDLDAPNWANLTLAGGGLLVPNNILPQVSLTRGMVKCKGRVERNSSAPLIRASDPTNGSGDCLLFTLPSGLRPNAEETFPCSVIDVSTSAAKTCRVRVQSNGQVYIYADAEDVQSVDLSPIHFHNDGS